LFFLVFDQGTSIQLFFLHSGNYDYEYNSHTYSSTGSPLTYAATVSNEDFLPSPYPKMYLYIICSIPVTVKLTSAAGTVAQFSVPFGTAYLDYFWAYIEDNICCYPYVPELNQFQGQNPNGIWTIVIDAGGSRFSCSNLEVGWGTSSVPAPPSCPVVTLTIHTAGLEDAGTPGKVYATFFSSTGQQSVRLSANGIAKGTHSFPFPNICIGVITQVGINTWSGDALTIQSVDITQGAWSGSAVNLQSIQSGQEKFWTF